MVKVYVPMYIVFCCLLKIDIRWNKKKRISLFMHCITYKMLWEDWVYSGQFSRIAKILKVWCYKLTSTKYDILYFLRKLIVIHSSINLTGTKIYTIQLKPVYRIYGRNLQRPKKNQGVHEILMLISDSNSHTDVY